MTTARDGKTLQTEVALMREKMQAHLGNKHRDHFDNTKLMKAVLRILSLSRNITVLPLRSRKT